MTPRLWQRVMSVHWFMVSKREHVANYRTPTQHSLDHSTAGWRDKISTHDTRVMRHDVLQQAGLFPVTHLQWEHQRQQIAAAAHYILTNALIYIYQNPIRLNILQEQVSVKNNGYKSTNFQHARRDLSTSSSQHCAGWWSTAPSTWMALTTSLSTTASDSLTSSQPTKIRL